MALGGCSADEPKELELDPVEQSPEPEPEEDEPEPIEDFVERFIAAENHAYATGDVEEFLALSTPDCEYCNDVADGLVEMYEAGGYYEGGDREIIDGPRVDLEHQPVATIAIREDAFVVVEAEGEAPEEFDVCEPITAAISLIEEGTTWRVEAVDTHSDC